MASQAPLKPGIYAIDGEAIGSLAPKFRGVSYGFMVTSAIGRRSDIQMWCADLVPAAKVPSGERAGLDVWALHGHPCNHVFVVDGDCLVECDAQFNQCNIWKKSQDYQGKLFREKATAPVLAEGFPSRNFIETVRDKDPKRNEPYSPSTQTIVEACARFEEPLSEDPRRRQEQLVQLYTDETPLYHEMNQALREDSMEKMRYFGAYIKELRDVFKTDHEDQIITPFEGTVWRGITFPDPDAAVRQYAVGSIFVWPAFTSMSTAKDAAMNFGNVVFQIACCPPPGHYDDDSPEYAPASVEKWSSYPSEQEILFPPNVKFRVQEIRQPDEENGLSSPLVVCETVGFDTDGGIIEFSKIRAEELRRKEQASVEAQLVALIKKHFQIAQQEQMGLDKCCEQVESCNGKVEDCLQRLQRLEDADRGREELKCQVAGLLSAQDPGKCASGSDVSQLRELLEAEKAERKAEDSQLGSRCDEMLSGQQDLARRCSEIEKGLQELTGRCNEVQKSVQGLAEGVTSHHNSVHERFEAAQAESAKGKSGVEQELGKLSQKMQAMLNETQKNQRALEKEVARLSSQLHEQLLADHRRTQDMDQVLKGLTDKCYMTNMILATEKLKHETFEIKSLLASEQKRAHSSSNRRSQPASGNARATLDAAVQGVSDIKSTLESLRVQLPSQVSGGYGSGLPISGLPEHSPGFSRLGSPLDTPRQGADHPVAAGGALQAARAARRPSAGIVPGEEG